MIGRYDSITVSIADINFITDRYLYLYEDVGSFSLCIESVAEVELRAFILDYYHNNYRGAKDGEDFDFPNHSFTAEQPFHNFTVYPRETRCFEIGIIDDNIAERDEPLYFYLGIYDPRPNVCDYWSAHIVDNDGKSCKCICTQSTFTARGTAEQKRSEAEECITVERLLYWTAWAICWYVCRSLLVTIRLNTSLRWEYRKPANVVQTVNTDQRSCVAYCKLVLLKKPLSMC